MGKRLWIDVFDRSFSVFVSNELFMMHECLLALASICSCLCADNCVVNPCFCFCHCVCSMADVEDRLYSVYPGNHLLSLPHPLTATSLASACVNPFHIFLPCACITHLSHVLFFLPVAHLLVLSCFIYQLQQLEDAAVREIPEWRRNHAIWGSGEAASCGQGRHWRRQSLRRASAANAVGSIWRLGRESVNEERDETREDDGSHIRRQKKLQERAIRKREIFLFLWASMQCGHSSFIDVFWCVSSLSNSGWLFVPLLSIASFLTRAMRMSHTSINIITYHFRTCVKRVGLSYDMRMIYLASCWFRTCFVTTS